MDRVCCHVCGRPIYWYGVWVALGLGAAYAHLERLARRERRPEDFASGVVFWATIGGIVGARVAYVLSNWPEYAGRWFEIFRIDHGGLIFYGGFLGGALALTWWASRRKVGWFELADFVTSGLPLGHAFGRIGCFINGCCYGRPWECGPSWTQGRIPVQLIESAANLFIYLILVRRYPRKKFHGEIFGWYLLLYPAVRFFDEFLRGDERMRLGALSIAQWVCIGLMVTALWLLSATKPRGSESPDRTP